MTTAGINTKPRIGALLHAPRPMDAEDIPLGSLIRTPLGLEAIVEGYRGRVKGRQSQRSVKGRGHRVWLVCRYTRPANKRYDVFALLPELAVVLRSGPALGVA